MKNVMSKHYVTYYSPGTFMAEQTTKEIESWDVDKAIEMSKDIKERHGALPYGFCFTTRGRTEKDLDSKETARSCMYYLGGEVLTLKEVKKQNNPGDKILISNMECNGWKRIVKNSNSYLWTQPLEDDDIVLDIKFDN